MKVPDNFLFYLSFHRDSTERLLCKARDLTAKDIEISTDPESIRLRKMIYSVMLEIHRMKGFIRLKPMGTHVLYGYFRPMHKIGGYVCDHFARRNSKTIVVLGNGTKSWVSFQKDRKILRIEGKGLAETLKRLRSSLDCSDTDWGVDEIWSIYYKSQYSHERRNLEAFYRRMPKRDMESTGLTIERNRNGATLWDFLSNDNSSKDGGS